MFLALHVDSGRSNNQRLCGPALRTFLELAQIRHFHHRNCMQHLSLRALGCNSASLTLTRGGYPRGLAADRRSVCGSDFPHMDIALILKELSYRCSGTTHSLRSVIEILSSVCRIDCL